MTPSASTSANTSQVNDIVFGAFGTLTNSTFSAPTNGSIESSLAAASLSSCWTAGQAGSAGAESAGVTASVSGNWLAAAAALKPALVLSSSWSSFDSSVSWTADSGLTSSISAAWLGIIVTLFPFVTAFSFSKPSTFQTGLPAANSGSIASGSEQGIWLQETIPAGLPVSNDVQILLALGGDG